MARRTDAATAAKLRRLTGIRVLQRSDASLVALFESKYRMERLIADNPDFMLAANASGFAGS